MNLKYGSHFQAWGPFHHTAFSLQRVTQQDGREAEQQVQSRDPGIWAMDLWIGKTPEAWLPKGHDAFKEDEVIEG